LAAAFSRKNTRFRSFAQCTVASPNDRFAQK
jgi:hypothetical protein